MTLSRRQNVTILALILYWPTLFVLTHVPVPELVRKADVSDKTLHFLAYLVLAFVLWFAVRGDRKVNWRRASAWWVLLIIVVYAILDEWLQSYVAGRSCDVQDFHADMAGALAGLILLSFFTYWPAGLLVTGTVMFGSTNLTRANLAELLPTANAVLHLFGYAFFTMLWVQYMHPFFPAKARKLEWLMTALTLPTALLITVKIFSIILGKDVVAQDVVTAVVGIAAVVATGYMTGLFHKRQETTSKTENFE